MITNSRLECLIDTRTPEEIRRQFGCLLVREAMASEIDEAVPAEHVIESSSNDPLCKQLLGEVDDIYSCNMTTTANAFIWQGWLSGAKAQYFHKMLPKIYHLGHFKEVINSEGQLRRWGHREEAAMRNFTGEYLYGYEAMQATDSQEAVSHKVCSLLSQDIVLNLADQRHSRLAIGYKKLGDETLLKIIDPSRPDEIVDLPVESVLNFSTSNEIFGVAGKTASMAFMPEIGYGR